MLITCLWLVGNSLSDRDNFYASAKRPSGDYMQVVVTADCEPGIPGQETSGDRAEHQDVIYQKNK